MSLSSGLPRCGEAPVERRRRQNSFLFSGLSPGHVSSFIINRPDNHPAKSPRHAAAVFTAEQGCSAAA